jgi:hypothetical protein
MAGGGVVYSLHADLLERGGGIPGYHLNVTSAAADSNVLRDYLPRGSNNMNKKQRPRGLSSEEKEHGKSLADGASGATFSNMGDGFDASNTSSSFSSASVASAAARRRDGGFDDCKLLSNVLNMLSVIISSRPFYSQAILQFVAGMLDPAAVARSSTVAAGGDEDGHGKMVVGQAILAEARAVLQAEQQKRDKERRDLTRLGGTR